MTTSNTKLTNKNEKGIALIFTLIMLSLMMILAMSFALDSMFSQKAAYNSASASSATFSAKAELNQLIIFLRKGNPVFTNSVIFSGGGSTGEYNTSTHDRDMLLQDSNDPAEYNSLLLAKGIIDKGNIEDLCFKSSLAEKDRISWTYHRDADDKIIGRTAFVIVPNEKIPLSSLISKDIDESGGATVDVYNEKRIGKNVSEINVRKALYPETVGDAAETYTITPAMADILNWKKDQDGVTSNRNAGTYIGLWSDYDVIFGSDYLDLETRITNASKRTMFMSNFKNMFSLDVKMEEEAFWVDLDGDSESDSNEIYKRFDLTRKDWTYAASPTAYSINRGFLRKVLLLTDIGTTLVTGMDTWKNEDSVGDFSTPGYSSSVSIGLPWLACFGYKDDGLGTDTWIPDESLRGTFDNVLARRFQIGANLKDYCDSSDDDQPTSDVNPKEWSNSTVGIIIPDNPHPTYTGNEKTPYIYKIGLRVEAERVNFENPFDPTDKSIIIKTKVQPVVGLINIYESGFSDNLIVTIYGEVTTKISVDGAAETHEQTIPFTKELPFANSAWSGGHSRVVLGSSTTGPERQPSIDITLPVYVKVTSVKIKKVVLHDASDSTKAYDYVRTLTSSPGDEAFPESTSEGTKSSWVGFAVHDPRQNLNLGDWMPLSLSVADTPVNPDTTDDNISKTFSVLVGDPPYYGAANSDNDDVANGGVGDNTEAPSVGGTEADVETASDPANVALSTAYIRNAAMESPWELGFIHRGFKWQTLNLTKYSNAVGRAYKAVTINSKKYIPGGGKYSDGDANILDQVKMTASAKSPEKINIATKESNILKTLFSNIKLGGTIASSMSVTSMTDTGTLLSLDSTQLNGIKSVFTSSTKTRACIAAKLATLSGGSVDADQEELIGKIVNLTKISGQGSSEYFTILVVAQSIKDIGGDGTNIDIYRVPADGASSEKVECQIRRFDVVGSSGSPTLDDNWKKNAYGDEITATQKILVKVTKSADGEVKIDNIKYMD